tara:strand:- start:85 stop:444 length:360 start_codon:yes stop_codon:yes gene_type:complete
MLNITVLVTNILHWMLTSSAFNDLIALVVILDKAQITLEIAGKTAEFTRVDFNASCLGMHGYHRSSAIDGAFTIPAVFHIVLGITATLILMLTFGAYTGILVMVESIIANKITNKETGV